MEDYCEEIASRLKTAVDKWLCGLIPKTRPQPL